jgi:hypothetical protein
MGASYKKKSNEKKNIPPSISKITPIALGQLGPSILGHPNQQSQELEPNKPHHQESRGKYLGT